MQINKRSRLFALIAALMLTIQFPVTELRVPSQFVDEVGSSKLLMTIPQVAVSAYHRNSGLSPKILKWFWLPGLAAFDAHNHLQCRFDKDHKACQEPVYSRQLDQVFSMTKPLVARSDIIWAAVKENFGGVAELLQAGSSLTLAAALISIIYPVKIGALGYGLVLYSLFKQKLTPTPQALFFTFVFVLATNVFSLFTARSEILAVRRQQQARAAQQAALSQKNKKNS